MTTKTENTEYYKGSTVTSRAAALKWIHDNAATKCGGSDVLIDARVRNSFHTLVANATSYCRLQDYHSQEQGVADADEEFCNGLAADLKKILAK